MAENMLRKNSSVVSIGYSDKSIKNKNKKRRPLRIIYKNNQ